MVQRTISCCPEHLQTLTCSHRSWSVLPAVPSAASSVFQSIGWVCSQSTLCTYVSQHFHSAVQLTFYFCFPIWRDALNFAPQPQRQCRLEICSTIGYRQLKSILALSHPYLKASEKDAYDSGRTFQWFRLLYLGWDLSRWWAFAW